LVEVMVALIVCSVGLLGLAKMESLALVSTSVASARSLAALQASSMAAAMHANRGYWAAGLAPATTIVDATVNHNFSAARSCTTGGACSVNEMAAYDLQQWAVALFPLLPSYSGLITCNTGTFPVNCTIQITWVENAVAANGSQTAITGLQAPTYVLYVEP
jgi:type IV pilus assembly protein PilV